ncbi:MAG: tRNA (adenosine(37)-N6)-threonylcarbamoyltransferase complex dimerization subunit type 1 TsaB [Reichenbachiella sp.]
MPLILGIESSTKAGSVAVIKDDLVLGSQHYHIDKSHSTLLHVMIEQLMANIGHELKDLDAVALAEGPGSYTGLRIGTSTAKGLCFALDIPLIAINTLESMSHQVRKINNTGDRYIPMIDARRMEVFALQTDQEGNVVNETCPVIIDELSYQEDLIDAKTYFFGDGAEKCKGVIHSDNACFINGISPSAVDVVEMAVSRFGKQQFENVISFEPFYLKEFRLATAKKS